MRCAAQVCAQRERAAEVTALAASLADAQRCAPQGSEVSTLRDEVAFCRTQTQDALNAAEKRRLDEVFELSSKLRASEQRACALQVRIHLSFMKSVK